MNKPKLFQDVDGCLIVPDAVPGYDRFSTAEGDHWFHPDTGERMRTIVAFFDVIWASHGWNQNKEYIEELFDLPSLPVLYLDDVEPLEDDTMNPEKLRRISDTLGDDYGVVIDDRMGGRVEKWSKGRSVLLINPAKPIGVTYLHHDLMMSFGRMLDSGAGAGLLGRIKK